LATQPLRLHAHSPPLTPTQTRFASRSPRSNPKKGTLNCRFDGFDGRSVRFHPRLPGFTSRAARFDAHSTRLTHRTARFDAKRIGRAVSFRREAKFTKETHPRSNARTNAGSSKSWRMASFKASSRPSLAPLPAMITSPELRSRPLT